MKKKAKYGVIHGRFQGLHHGHIKYLMAGKEKCDFLYIGIANPDPSVTLEHPSNIKRAERRNNPFYYFERMEMIRETFLDLGINRNEFEIVPFPINYPELIKYYVPTNALFLMTILDAWGEHKLRVLKNEKFIVEVMWRAKDEERDITGTILRNAIANDLDWEHFVPKPVELYIKEKKLDLRIKEIFGS